MFGRLIPALAALFILIAACGGDDEEPGPTASPTDAAATPTERPPEDSCAINLEARAEEPVTWQQVLPADISAPVGWQVIEGEGEGPFLTVLQGDVAIGSVELLQFPLEPDFQPDAGLGALQDWAEEYYTSIEEDRRASYGETYVFEREEPAEAAFGRLCGIAYGFTGSQDGRVLDAVAGHATFDSVSLYLVVASYDVANAAEGIGFTDPDALQEYAPSLSDLVAGLNFPPE